MTLRESLGGLCTISKIPKTTINIVDKNMSPIIRGKVINIYGDFKSLLDYGVLEISSSNNEINIKLDI